MRPNRIRATASKCSTSSSLGDVDLNRHSADIRSHRADGGAVDIGAGDHPAIVREMAGNGAADAAGGAGDDAGAGCSRRHAHQRSEIAWQREA
jgi:hypothetical protein